jgi:hypothetical protein
MNLQSHELREFVKFGNLPKVKFRSHGARKFPENGEIHELVGSKVKDVISESLCLASELVADL